MAIVGGVLTTVPGPGSTHKWGQPPVSARIHSPSPRNRRRHPVLEFDSSTTWQAWSAKPAPASA
jgi:hypothetical protein